MEAATETKKGFQKTKVGWIPEDWFVTDLLSSTSYTKGCAFKSKDYNSIGTRIIRVSDTSATSIKEVNPIFVDNTNGEYDKWKLNEFDLVFTTVGSRPPMYDSMVGKVIQISKKHKGSLLNQNAVKITGKHEKVNPQFLFNQFKGKRYLNFIETIVRGNANQVSITLEDLFSYSFALPPLPEQQKIAQILSTWDKAIEKTQNLIEQLKKRKKGLMQQLLTGKTRLKGFSGEWKEVKLDDVATRLTDKNVELNDNVVTISAQRGFVKQEDFFKKRVASDTLSGYYLIKKGQFAYNKSYSNGYPMGAFKRLDSLDKAVVTTLYICFELKNNVDSDFMVNYFEGGLMIRNLMKIAQEGGRAHGLLNIALNDFFSLKMTIPSLDEQQAIAKVLTTADKEIKAQETYLQQLQDQKKGLMQQLLTGQKRVKVV